MIPPMHDDDSKALNSFQFYVYSVHNEKMGRRKEKKGVRRAVACLYIACTV